MIPAVLFDIDGTLIDSNYLHVEAWSRALAKTGAVVDTVRIHRSIGMDSERLLQALIGDRAEDLGERASALHAVYYAELTSRLRAFDGARELLTTLAARGVAVVLATSAPADELAELRRVLDAEGAITAVTSSEDVGTAKPEPGIVEVALDKAGVAAADAMFVGDTVWDVEAAARAGVRSIGVTSGGISAQELLDAGAVTVYENVASLRATLDTSPLSV